MNGRVFVDSNVWLYAFAINDPERMSLAQGFINKNVASGSLFVSWQIINEVGYNLLKKGVADRVAFEMVERIRISCTVVDFSAELLSRAFELRQNHSLSYWDSLVVSAAQEADCEILASEDMQNCKLFGRLVIRNIFKKS